VSVSPETVALTMGGVVAVREEGAGHVVDAGPLEVHATGDGDGDGEAVPPPPHAAAASTAANEVDNQRAAETPLTMPIERLLLPVVTGRLALRHEVIGTTELITSGHRTRCELAMGKRFLAGLVLLLAACSSSSPTSSVSPLASPTATAANLPTASPAPPTSGAHLFVAVSGGPWVGLATIDGRVVAQANTGQMEFWYSDIPEVSISRTRLYYLTTDDFSVHYLQPDGGTGVATKIAFGADDAALFAVSPDDSRIAVSVINYAPRRSSYLGMRLYVEDLQGGGHHLDIFSSTTAVEFPIGWVNGRLIVAVSNWIGPHGGSFVNPYGASAYHVADATNGDRVASLCDNSVGPVGWIEPAGTMCSRQSSGPSFLRWDGSAFAAPAATPNSYQLWQVALSPDAIHVALAGDRVRIMGGVDDLLPVAAWNVFGWLDASHIVYQRPASLSLSIFDLESRGTVDLSRGNTYLGALPVAVS
jgi:hypothetical protein